MVASRLAAVLRSACACALLLVPGVQAATVPDLHTASVPVADNSDAERARGIAAAFRQVLVKITGDSAGAAVKAFNSLGPRAQRFNTLYGYENTADGGLALRADFDLAAVGAALRERNLPVWGKERPEVAAWLLLVDASGARSTPDEMTAEIFESLSRQAAVRAIPLRRYALPGPLLADYTAARDPEAVFENVLSTAAVPAPARLVMLIEQAPPPETGWQARWRLSVDDQIVDGTASDALPVPLVVTGLDRALDALAQHYTAAIESGAASRLEISVDGIDSPAAYGRALNHLEDLDAVQRLEVIAVSGTRVVFGATVRGGLAALDQGIGFARVLVAQPDAPGRYVLGAP